MFATSNGRRFTSSTAGEGKLASNPKSFGTKAKAEEYARRFDYARGLLRQPPLAVYQRDNGEWAVETSVECVARVARERGTKVE
jgi:hypothetical protein